MNKQGIVFVFQVNPYPIMSFPFDFCGIILQGIFATVIEFFLSFPKSLNLWIFTLFFFIHMYW